MLDKNGTIIKQGDKIVDVHGTVGIMTDIGGAEAIRFDKDGEASYVFARLIVSKEICVVGSCD